MSKILSFFKRPSRSNSDFEALVAPYMAALHRQAFKYAGNESEAEDLLQEVLIEAYQRIDALQAAPMPLAWLTRCLYHRFVDTYRKQKARPALEDIDALHLRDEPQAAGSPEAHYWHSQVLKSLTLLSPEQRMVVSLHDMEGYTLVELANIVEMPLGTLKSHLHRARKILQQEFKLQPFQPATRYK